MIEQEMMKYFEENPNEAKMWAVYLINKYLDVDDLDKIITGCFDRVKRLISEHATKRANAENVVGVAYSYLSKRCPEDQLTRIEDVIINSGSMGGSQLAKELEAKHHDRLERYREEYKKRYSGEAWRDESCNQSRSYFK